MLNKSASFIAFIERWQKENPHFPLNQQKMRVFKQGIVQWNSQKLPINQQSKPFIHLYRIVIDKVQQYNKDRLQRFLSLVQRENPVNENAYDSDDDMYDHRF